MHHEVVELLDDLLAGLAREELRVLDDRRVHLLESERRATSRKWPKSQFRSRMSSG